MAWAAGSEWTSTVKGAFGVSRSVAVLTAEGVATRCLQITYPRQTTSQPGEYGAWQTEVRLPAGPAALRFHYADDFAGAVSGYHVLQVLLDDTVVWEQDVAGGTPELAKAEVPLAAAAGTHRLVFRVVEKATVTNFPIRVQVAGVVLQAGDEETALLPVEAPAGGARPFPPDLPLPSLPIAGGWSWQANILQPWGKTQTVAVREAEQWAPRLARDYGLNALIMLPPPAHNAISAPPNHITEEQFRAALAAYRREGMKTILYTSIMHKGHDPEWQEGRLAAQHPEWAMRDPRGETITLYGHPWLCPATGALEYTLEYTAGLVRAYDPDGVMLDNNEFLTTAAGHLTCYCASCQAAFARYVNRRFTPAALELHLGLKPDQVRVPEDPDHPLWGLWFSWRNRPWAEACERYRQRLRELKPNLVVSANTQYLYKSGVLAVDGQYAHLDAFLAESRGLQGPGMAAKMLLGRALAAGRPLWNYIGTFDEEDFTRLRPANEVAAVCAASEAYGANPWIVFYGFTGDVNQAALAVIRQYTDFWRDNAALLGAGQARGDVGWLFSTESRDLAGESLSPPLLADLLREGLALRGLRDTAGLAAEDWSGLNLLLATHASCLRQATAAALAAWVKRGGRLVISPATGWRDEYGRWRLRPALNEAVGQNVAPPGTYRWGRGEIICVPGEASVPELVRRHVRPRVAGTGALGASWTRAADGRDVMAVTGFAGEIGRVTVRLPGDARRVELRLPGGQSQALTASGPAGQRTVTCEIPGYLGLVVSGR